MAKLDDNLDYHSSDINFLFFFCSKLYNILFSKFSHIKTQKLKISTQDFNSRFPLKISPRDFPTRFSLEIFIRDFPSRLFLEIFPRAQFAGFLGYPP